MPGRYDKRSANGQLEQERQRERELRAIRKRIKLLIEKLEGCQPFPHQHGLFRSEEQCPSADRS